MGRGAGGSAWRPGVRGRAWRRGGTTGADPDRRRPRGDGELTGPHRRGLLRTVTDTCVHLWRRVHMDLVRYAGCVCRPSC
ncbi:putative leader peptide [Streptomyces mutabilis]|uniref:putative leader peptide n=1 Tax=Streptomyces mutabilis TaxID=67332 RepID=UPI0033B0574E